MYKMETRGNLGDRLRVNFRLIIGSFAAMMLFSLYGSLTFYMEHSFLLTRPDIDYLVNRY